MPCYMLQSVSDACSSTVPPASCERSICVLCTASSRRASGDMLTDVQYYAIKSISCSSFVLLWAKRNEATFKERGRSY
jgi:hypothetical protein